MPKTKYTVVTDLGTFTRQTHRTYSHIVVVKDYTKEHCEGVRRDCIKSLLKDIVEYERDEKDGGAAYRAKHNGTGAYAGVCDFYNAEWIAKHLASAREQLVKHTAKGPVTKDVENEAGPLGWCGSLTLARKLASGSMARVHRTVRIYAVDGTRVQ